MYTAGGDAIVIATLVGTLIEGGALTKLEEALKELRQKLDGGLIDAFKKQWSDIRKMLADDGVKLRLIKEPGQKVPIYGRSPYWTDLDVENVKKKFKKVLVCFDDLGFLDFSDFIYQAGGIVYEVTINDMGSTTDFTQANKEMAKKLNIDKFDLDAFTDENGLKYTWHHHQDGKTMQLVPGVVNGSVNHLGGNGIMEKGKSINKSFKDMLPSPELTKKYFRTICK
jgi:hypothetical protein